MKIIAGHNRRFLPGTVLHLPSSEKPGRTEPWVDLAVRNELTPYS
jgi:hypothetical protein